MIWMPDRMTIGSILDWKWAITQREDDKAESAEEMDRFEDDE